MSEYEEQEETLSLDTILSSDNIAEELSEEFLRKLACKVVDGYQADLQSRAGWETNLDEWMEMALQVAQDKTYPWTGAANIKYPLLTTAAIQFSSRAYPALVPGTNVVKGRIVGKDNDGLKAVKADLIGKHMSYQILEEMPDWEEEMDRLCVSLPILGTMFKKTYYDPVDKRNVSELVYPKELVVNYYAKSLETAVRKTHVIELSENDMHERVNAGLYLEHEEEVEEGFSSDTPRRTNIDDSEPPPDGDESTPYEVLEQHAFCDLDGDGYEEPYIITVHKKSKKVLRIVARFNENGIITNDNDDVVKIKPIEYFTKFSFVPNPDGGFYDIGFGLLLGPINDTVNTIINQLVDAGTLSNLQAGYISKGLRIKGGNHNFRPGEWKFVNSVGDDLRKNIMPLPVREPSNVLFTLLGMMIESGQKLASVTDMLLGENPGQNQPATTTMAVLEQGLKVFTSIYKRLHRSLKKEYRKLFLLNSEYLEDASWFTILDAGDEEAAPIKRTYYSVEDADVIPSSDPNVASSSVKLMKASGLMELLQLGTINPIEATKRILDAQEQPGIEALMTMPEQGPSPEQMEFELEKMKFEDESRRAWAELAIKAKDMDIKDLQTQADAFSKVAKVDIDSQQKQGDSSPQ